MHCTARPILARPAAGEASPPNRGNLGGRLLAGGMSVGVETRHVEKVEKGSPSASAVMILGGVSMMVSGKLRN